MAIRWLYDDETLDVESCFKTAYSSNLTCRLQPFFEELLIDHTVKDATNIANQNGFYFEHREPDHTLALYEGRIRYLEKNGIVTEIFMEITDDMLY